MSKAQDAVNSLALTGNTRKLVVAGYRISRAERVSDATVKRVMADGKTWIAELREQVSANDADAQRVARHQFQIGKLMDRLTATSANADPMDVSGVTEEAWERARIIFYSQSYKSDAPKGAKPRRNKTQETAWEAARKGWTRFIASIGVKSLDKRGGARTMPQAEAAKPEAAKPEAEAAKPQAESVPLAKSNAAVAKWLNEQSAIMTTFLSRASLDGGVTVPDNVKAAVDAFRRDIEAAIKANKANK